MKFVYALLLSTVLLQAADPQSKKKAPAPAAAPAAAPSAPAPAAPPQRLEIPKGAVEQDPGRFFYTDAEGKKWIYVRTPFGVSRLEDKSAVRTDAPTAARAADPFANVKITEKNGIVVFERPTGFGTSKWQKKKSELTPEENAALRRSNETTTTPMPNTDASKKQDR
jgi:hypothetical protein